MNRMEQEKKRIEQFIDYRNKVFTDAVVNNNWKGVKKYCVKYMIPIPENEDVLKAGLYKAVMNAGGIQPGVKRLARKKCIELGFLPESVIGEESEHAD